MVLKIRLMEVRKDYVFPPTQPNPNIPKIYLKLYIQDYQSEVEVYADWSDNAGTRKANVVTAVKNALDALVDAEGIKGEWTYDYATKTLTRVT